MSMTSITTDTDIASCVAFELIGGARINCSNLAIGEKITIYEECADDEYRAALDQNGREIMIVYPQRSILVEGYGNYKALSSAAGKVVGYASA